MMNSASVNQNRADYDSMVAPLIHISATEILARLKPGVGMYEWVRRMDEEAGRIILLVLDCQANPDGHLGAVRE